MTLHVELVVPRGRLWAGEARMVIAKTLDGDMGVLTGHTPVLGILAEGSVVRVFPDESQDELSAAVAGGFLSVADDRVSILARQAQLGAEVDLRAVRAELAEQEAAAPHGQAASEESAAVRYLRAQLRAAGDET
jgi:F-type H+-transporting ATPase subunit epsilon